MIKLSISRESLGYQPRCIASSLYRFRCRSVALYVDLCGALCGALGSDLCIAPCRDLCVALCISPCVIFSVMHSVWQSTRNFVRRAAAKVWLLDLLS